MATVRKIIRIDEAKCDGCGECVSACAEGAIAIVGGKARLVSETYCDGLGNCLGTCPQQAIIIEEREADEFHADAAAMRMGTKESAAGKGDSAPKISGSSSTLQRPTCPGARALSFSRDRCGTGTEAASGGSELINWPVKLMLAPGTAPCYQGARLVLAADCVPFACADFHRRFLGGKPLLTACPKFGKTDVHLDRLTGILKENDIRAIEVLYMEVPCCFGLVWLAKQALADAGKDIPVRLTKISIRGDILDHEEVPARSEAGGR